VEGKKTTFSKIKEWLGATIIILLMIFIFLGFFANIETAINLANNGISTTATVLQYRVMTTGEASLNYSALISYDKYREFINLENGQHQINSKISVIYHKRNPKLVWLGSRDMTAWDLYCLNVNLGKDIFLLISIAIGFRYLIRFTKNP